MPSYQLLFVQSSWCFRVLFAKSRQSRVLDALTKMMVCSIQATQGQDAEIKVFVNSIKTISCDGCLDKNFLIQSRQYHIQDALIEIIHSKKKSVSEHLFWCFRLSQIEDSIEYLEGPNST